MLRFWILHIDSWLGLLSFPFSILSCISSMCFDLFLNFHCFLAYNIYFGPSEFYICFNWYVDEHQKEIQTWTYCCESIKSRHLYFWLWFLQFLMFISYIIFTTNILWSIKPMTCQDWIFFYWCLLFVRSLKNWKYAYRVFDELP